MALAFADVTFVIDASNVCWGAALSWHPGDIKSNARPPLRGLVICVNFFEAYRARGANVIAVAPGWWSRLTHMATDDQDAFEQLKDAGVLLLAPEKVHDDLVILGCSLAEGRIAIITNDKFRDHQMNLGLRADWYAQRQVSFEFDGDIFLPDIEALERILGDVSLVNTIQPFALPAAWDASATAADQSHVDHVQLYEEYCELDPSLVGLMIGKGGSRIKAIESRYGTEILVRNGMARFSGLSPDRVFWAKIAFLSVKPPKRTRFDVPVTDSYTEMEIEQSTISPRIPSIARRDLMDHKDQFMEVVTSPNNNKFKPNNTIVEDSASSAQNVAEQPNPSVANIAKRDLCRPTATLSVSSSLSTPITRATSAFASPVTPTIGDGYGNESYSKSAYHQSRTPNIAKRDILRPSAETTAMFSMSSGPKYSNYSSSISSYVNDRLTTTTSKPNIAPRDSLRPKPGATVSDSTSISQSTSNSTVKPSIAPRDLSRRPIARKPSSGSLSDL